MANEVKTVEIKVIEGTDLSRLLSILENSVMEEEFNDAIDVRVVD